MLYFNDNSYTDNEFSRILILSYLKKYFDNSSIENLKETLTPIQLAKLLGEKDFSFFCLYYLRDYFIASDDNYNRNLARVHLEIWEELNKMFSYDLWDKEEFILPRGCAKSTVINKALSCWQHCYKKSRYTIVLGNKESDAVSFVDDTKMMLKNHLIEETFGILVDSRNRTVNKLELELTNDTKIQAFSWGSSVRGTTYGCKDGIFRPSIIILDDIIKEDDILSDEAKAKVINKFTKEVLEVGEKEVVRNGKKIRPASKFIILGTPLATDCFINTIKRDPSFKVFHRQVCNFNVDEYFLENNYWQTFKDILFNPNIKGDRQKLAREYYDNNLENMCFDTIWEKYNCYDLAMTYFTKRLAFMQELQCDCEKVGEIWIKSMAKLPTSDIESRTFEKTILAIDQASSNSLKSDFTAFTILSKSNGLYFVRKGELGKFDSKTEFNLYIDTVIDMLMKYQEITHIILEKNVYKGLDATRIEERISEIYELKTRNIKVSLVYNTKNKDDRISTITDKINSGQVIFNENNEEYNRQISSFKGQRYTKNDDAIDSLEMAINHIDTIMVNNKISFLPYSSLF